ncbi:hypothetical protein P7L75_11610 [Tistrella mobilis]|uniref:hypothetical protein n=1 Tax=Tistrella mobilis TaxID=171437 RepID=UPI003558F5C7
MADALGGMSLGEIEAASKELPFPDNAGASPSERFVLKVSALVRVRHAQGDSGGVAVFLQSDALQSDAECCDGSFHPLLATGNDPITEKVWLSNATLGGAYALNVDCSSQGVIFEKVRALGFERLPALVIDWRGAVPVGRFYARGLGDLDHVQEVLLAYTEISAADLKGCLDNAHRTGLETPQRVGEGHAEQIWKDASKGFPAPRPEERIQGKLINHLRARYTQHVVRAERKNNDGITDLMIFAHTQDVGGQKIVVNEWLLELKALTDRTENGNTIGPADIKKRISDGLKQAICYRNEEHARHAALCCYDMRTNDEGDEACFADVRDDAADEAVVLWRWYLFRSSKALRTEKQAAKKASGALQR